MTLDKNSLFKPKRTGTMFELADVDGAFEETGYASKSEINIEKLITDIQTFSGNKTLDDFYYKDYPASGENAGNYDLNPTILEDLAVKVDATFTAKSYLGIENRTSLTDEITVLVNRRAGILDLKASYSFSVDVSKEYISYKMFFGFIEETELKKGDLRYETSIINSSTNSIYEEKTKIIAVNFTSQSFEWFSYLVDRVDPSGTFIVLIKRLLDQTYVKLATKRVSALTRNLPETYSDVRSFYNMVPDFYFTRMQEDALFEDLRLMLRYDASSSFIDTGLVMLKLLNQFKDSKSIYDRFYSNPTLVKSIYSHINSHTGENSTNAYCEFLTALTIAFASGDDFETLPVVRIGKDYTLDSDLFFGDDDKIYLKVEQVITSTRTKDYDFNSTKGDLDMMKGDFTSNEYIEVLNGSYHPMQLVKLVNTDSGEVSFVTALHVKRLADIDEWAYIVEVFSNVLTVISIFTSVGIVIRAGSLLAKILAVTDIAIGVIDLALSIDSIRKALRSSGPTGKWLEENWDKISIISSTGVMTLEFATAFLKRSAKAKAILDELDSPEHKKFIEKIEESAIDNLPEADLDWMKRLSKSGNFGGSILTLKQIKALKKLLKNKYGVELIYEGASDIKRLFKPIGEFKSAQELFQYMSSYRPKKVGSFDHKTKQMFLPKDTTELVAFHELMHVQHWNLVGGSEIYNTISKLDREMFVWQKIYKSRSNWTLEELDDALGYINRERQKAGKSKLNITL